MGERASIVGAMVGPRMSAVVPTEPAHGTTGRSSDLLSALRSVERSIRMLSEHERRIAGILAGSRTHSTTLHLSKWAQWRYCEEPEVLLDLGFPGESDDPEPLTVAPHPNPLAEFVSTINQDPTSPFDELIAAVSVSPPSRPRRSGPPPPPERFRVRVAPVRPPHRATKRNYDYFEELNAALDEQRRG